MRIALRTDESRNNVTGGEVGRPRSADHHIELLTAYAEGVDHLLPHRRPAG